MMWSYYFGFAQDSILGQFKGDNSESEEKVPKKFTLDQLSIFGRKCCFGDHDVDMFPSVHRTYVQVYGWRAGQDIDVPRFTGA